MRRAFTLLELLISVLLLFLIVFFLGRSYATLKSAAETGQRHERAQSEMHTFSQLLVRDFLQASEMNVTAGRHYDTVLLKGVAHSLYGRSRAEVSYAVLKPQKQLIRMERGKTVFLPVAPIEAHNVDFLVLPPELKSFKVIRSEKNAESNSTRGCCLLIFVEFEEGREPLLLELGLLNHEAC